MCTCCRRLHLYCVSKIKLKIALLWKYVKMTYNMERSIITTLNITYIIYICIICFSNINGSNVMSWKPTTLYIVLYIITEKIIHNVAILLTTDLDNIMCHLNSSDHTDNKFCSHVLYLFFSKKKDSTNLNWKIVCSIQWQQDKSIDLCAINRFKIFQSYRFRHKADEN